MDYANNKVEKSWVMFSLGTIPGLGPVRLRKVELDWERRTL